MEYSALIQPVPVFLRNGGTFSSIDALQSTTVSPNSISTEPSAYFVKFLVIFISLSILLSFDIYFSFVANSL